MRIPYLGPLRLSTTCLFIGSGIALAQPIAPTDVKDVSKPAAPSPAGAFSASSKGKPEVKRDEVLDMPAATGPSRRFHEVLDELMIEFGYDLKLGQVNGIKNLAIRKAEVNEALPAAYRKYLKMLITERIQMNTDVHLINCITCENKYSKITDGKLIVTSPTTNAALLKSSAEQLGIEYFMDVMLVYHPTQMVLAFEIFKSDTNELVWSRAYNSETIRSRYQRLAVDYKQVEKSRNSNEYVPEYRILAGAGMAYLPNLGSSGNKAMIAAEARATERFNKRHSEFGFSFTYLKTMASLEKLPVTPPATSTTPVPFQNAFLLNVLYGHYFLGSVEDYDEMRQGFHIGAGALVAGLYFAGTVRLGWDFFFGRRWAITVSGIDVLPSSMLVNAQSVSIKGGFGGEALVSFAF